MPLSRSHGLSLAISMFVLLAAAHPLGMITVVVAQARQAEANMTAPEVVRPGAPIRLILREDEFTSLFWYGHEYWNVERVHIELHTEDGKSIPVSGVKSHQAKWTENVKYSTTRYNDLPEYTPVELWIEFTLPADSALLGRSLTGRAVMDITYAVDAGKDRVENRSQHIEEDVRFRVGTADQIAKYDRGGWLRSLGRLGAFIGGAVLLVVCLWVMSLLLPRNH
jgi:hypothetical protein